jgi:hypothetical protein
MGSSQFIHLGAYGRTSRKGEPEWAHVAGVLGEGGRAPGAVGHLKNSCSPNILFGMSPENLIADALGLTDVALDAKGRNLRRDGSVLVAGVVGNPLRIDDGLRDPVEADLYRLWRTETVDWLKQRFSPTLRSIVEHVDEDRYHLHFYCLPTLNLDSRLDWSGAHPGLAAKRSAAAAGENKQEQERRYRAAMRVLQDEFFAAVSRAHCHSRYGPQRERVSRMERAAQKRIELERAEMGELVRIQEHEALLRAEQEGRERVGAQMQMMQQVIEGSRQEVELERDRADRAEAEIARLLELMAMNQGLGAP